MDLVVRQSEIDQADGSKAGEAFQSGLSHLRRFEAVKAIESLEAGLEVEPDHALSHAALAEAWSLLRYDAKAAEAAARALQAVENLSTRDRWIVEGRHHEIRQSWTEAIASYETLFDAYPNNVDYGLWLCWMQIKNRDYEAAAKTVHRLRQLPSPANEDPRIDHHEARIHLQRREFDTSLEIAARAVEKGRHMKADLIVAYARVVETVALGRKGEVTSRQRMEAVEESRQIFEKRGHRHALAKSLDFAGAAFLGTGDLNAAQRSWQQAEAIYKEVGHQKSAANALGNLGIVAQDRGRFVEAETLYQSVLALYRQLGDTSRTAWALTNLGVLAQERGQLNLALEHYQEALGIYEDLEDTGNANFVQGNMADALTFQGNLATAVALFDQVLAYERQQGNSTAVALQRFQRAQLSTIEDDLFTARQELHGALDGQHRLSEWVSEAETRLALAELVLLEGNAELAEQLALKAEEVLRIEGLSDLAALADALLARALLAQGKLRAARAISSQALRAAADSDDFRLHFAAATTDAKVQAVVGDGRVDVVLHRLDAMAEEASEAGLVASAFEARLVAGEIEAQNGAIPSARARLRDLARDAESLGYKRFRRRAMSVLQRIGED